MSDEPAPGGPGALVFDGVALEAQGGGPAPLAQGLGLVVDVAGLTITGPAPGSARRLGWVELADVGADERATFPGGAPAFALVGTIGSRRLRWLIPAHQLPPERRAALEGLLGRAAGSVRAPSSPGQPAATLPSRLPPPTVPPPTGPPPTGPPPTVPPPLPPGPPPGPVSRPHRAPRHRRRRHKKTVALVAAVVVVVGAGVGAVVVLGGPGPHPPAGAPGPSGDEEVAQQINISASDVPSTWSVDSSASGPLGAFFSGGGGTARPTAAERRLERQVAAGYEQCLGIPAAADRIFGSDGSTPTAEAASPVFAAPTAGPVSETGSQAQVFATRADVAADVAQVERAQFPLCFGAALGKEFVAGTRGAVAGGASVGTPQIQLLDLPQTPGVHVVGVELTFPITSATGTVSTQFAFVLTAGGRVEATLITFAAATSFPAPLTASLTATLEHNIAARGTSVGA